MKLRTSILSTTYCLAKMAVVRTATFGAWLLFSVVVLSGCVLLQPVPEGEPVDLTMSDVVGVWCKVLSDDTIVFHADGTFEATNLPYQMLARFDLLPPDFDPEQDRLPAHGRWELGPLGQTADVRKNRVTVAPEVVAGRPDSGAYQLRAEKVGGVLTLSYYLGDPDLGNRIRYERRPDESPSHDTKSRSDAPIESVGWCSGRPR